MPDNILIIKLGALGDFIQALGPMAAIRRHHKADVLTLLTTAPFEKIAKECGYFDKILIDDKPKWPDLRGWFSLRKTLNAGRYKRVYDLQNNDRTSLYFRLFSPKPEWVGAAKGASHRNASKYRTKGRAFNGHVQTLHLAGIENVSPDALLWMAGGEIPEGLRAPYVLIVPGSAPSHPDKRWPHDRYGALCRRLLEKGIQPVLIGTSAEEDDLFKIERIAPGVLNLCGKTSLFDIPALARNAAGAVGNDTGPVHLIAPTGCKTIVLFSGKTDPKRHAPLGDAVTVIQEENLHNLDIEKVWSAVMAQHISS